MILPPTRNGFVWLRLLLLLLFSTALLEAQTPSPNPAPEQAWPVPGAAYKVTIEKAKRSRWPADASSVAVWSVGLNPAKCHVRAFRENGSEVGTKIYWAAPGEPLKILFDSALGDTKYTLFVSADRSGTPPQWEPAQGLLLETRAKPDGPYDTLEQTQKLWKTATAIQGRSYVDRIFQGVNLHGPYENYLSFYTGQFAAITNGTYEFATSSDDASFLFIDGKRVAEWGGIHGPENRVDPQHSGKINLVAGLHRIEYLHAQGTGEAAAIAAWKQPGKSHFVLMPEEVFTPVGSFEATGYTAHPRAQNTLFFQWETAQQNIVDGLALIHTSLRMLQPDPTLTYRWSFDDGTAGVGQALLHVFPRPGLRSVTLEALSLDRTVAKVTQQIRVQPKWSQPEQWSDGLFEQERAEFLNRDISAMPVADLFHLARFACAANDPRLATKLAPRCLDKQSEAKPDDSPLFLQLGNQLRRHLAREYALADQCYRAAIARAGSDENTAEKAKLSLASLLLECEGKPSEAQKLLGTIRDDKLSPEEQRSRKILAGDTSLLSGDVENARKSYEAAGGSNPNRDRLEAVRRRIRIEAARDFVRRQEYDSAEEIAAQAEWDSPLEKLSVETGVLLVNVFKGRKEFPRALSRCEGLMFLAGTDTERSELLMTLAELHFAANDPAQARTALAKLWKDYPYSESAALAKDRWKDEFQQQSKPAPPK